MGLDINPDDDFHVVLNGVVTALSLNALDAAYQGDAIQDETLIWQEGLSEWMRLDTLLAALEEQDQHFAPAPPVDEDIYFVLVADDEVKKMTLEVLDDAYRLDIIDESNLVWQPGYTEWIPLSVLLGGAEPMPHVSIAPSTVPARSPVSAVGGASAGLAPSIPPQMMPQGAHISAGSLVADIPLPPVALPASPWFRRSLVAVSLCAFVLILHRNGVTYELAQNIEQEDEFLKWESKLGTPTLQTPHQLSLWLEQISEKYHLADLSETEPVPGAPRKEETSSDASKSLADSSEKKKGEGAVKASGADSEAAKEGANEKGAQAADFGTLLSGKKVAPKTSPKKKKTWRPKKSKQFSSGLADDPMNGAL